ncbi:hypothetical protein ACR8AL_00785 [Clavibacter sepedonicus]|uniref:hypothetical protein n=1 Tax=Clavibacter TaxID=1573 RepID=UPI0002E33AB8|nr:MULTISPECIES: hypothetical protein [Clavibacter]UUK64812.1 hypothetical protein LRE50_11000 [Clavibacter sepedonicus]
MIGRTRIDANDLIRETAVSSAYPDVVAWLQEAVRRPSTDREALAAFGPRDGR